MQQCYTSAFMIRKITPLFSPLPIAINRILQVLVNEKKDKVQLQYQNRKDLFLQQTDGLVPIKQIENSCKCKDSAVSSHKYNTVCPGFLVIRQSFIRQHREKKPKRKHLVYGREHRICANWALKKFMHATAGGYARLNTRRGRRLA